MKAALGVGESWLLWVSKASPGNFTLYNTWMEEYWKSTGRGNTMLDTILDAMYSSGPSSHPSTNYKFQRRGDYMLRDLP